MQKTEHVARLLHLSTTGKSFCIITALLISAAVSVCAGEPVMTLALADQHQSPVESNAPEPTDLLSGVDSSLFDLKSSPPAASRPGKEMPVEFSTGTLLEEQARFSHGDSLQLVRENRTSASRSNVTFSVQAGYGRIWDEKSMLQKISDGHQESGCAYVSANFSF
ncbi:MAG: hypothetical protein PHY43_01900 [Verrucomicrobiales bacterium]|nr:hypothetical protein [Verrucomicrobiales bacterium]